MMTCDDLRKLPVGATLYYFATAASLYPNYRKVKYLGVINSMVKIEWTLDNGITKQTMAKPNRIRKCDANGRMAP